MTTTMVLKKVNRKTGGLALIRRTLIAGALAPFLAFSLAGCTGTVFQSLFAEGNEAAILAMTLLNGSPRITSVTSNKDDGRYGIGSVINVTVTFSKPVTLADENLNITLDSGAVIAIAPFTNATTASATYTVAAGQNSADLRASAFNLDPGATLVETGKTKPASLNLPGINFSSKNIIIDTTPPAISSVTSSTASGLYGIDDSINVTVVFTEAIVLTGGPLNVTLDTGDVLSVNAGSYPASQLTGTYTVGTGDTSADLNSNSSLSLAAGTITDTCDENVNAMADFSIPSGENLADNKDIVIDGVAPTNQDSVFSPSATKKGTDTVTIASSGDTTNTVWFAPLGTTNFVEGPTMTSAGGTATVIDSPDAEGTYYCYIIDAAGNLSSPSTAVLTVDNTDPAIAITSPNGGLDFTTGTADQTLSGTCSSDPSVIISTSTGTVSDGDCSDGTWSLNAITLAEEANTITVTATDGAGNAASDSITITLDTSLRDIAITYLQGADTTSPFRAGSLAITATFSVPPLGTPQIAIDQAGTNDLTATDMSGSGTTWTYTYTVNAAGGGNADGAATITLSNIVPTGGGIYGTPTDRVFTIDTTAAAPSVPDLAAGDDTGPFDDDDTTSQTTGLTFSGTAESNASIELFDGMTSLGTAPADISGNWIITVNLSAGAYSINAVQTDAVGNVSPASGNLSLTIDTSASAPSAPNLDATDDTGSSDSDNITKNTSGLTFTGTSENNAAIRLYDGMTQLGATTADGSGNWTVDLSLSAGTYTIHSVQTDLAGNVSPASGTLSLTIDTSAAAPSVPDLDEGDDSGTSNSDNETSQTSGLTFSGNAEGDAAIEIFDGSTSIGTTTADGSGGWTIELSLTAGSHSISAVQTDPAGNTSSPSGSLSVTIDTTAPTVSIGAPSPSYVNSAGTVDYPVTYTGAAAINLTSGDVTVNPTGTASCTKTVLNGTTATPTVRLTNCLGDGTADIAISAGTSSDDAGNNDTGDSTSTAFYVDNTDPSISSIAPANSATVNSTLVSYTYSEICATGSITWTRTGGSSDSDHAQSLTGSELNAGAHNNITIANNPTLVDGAIYTIAWDCTDRAGNVATTVSSTNVTYTDSALAIVGAETMDTDNDGKIDTYRVAFNKSVDDDTFPGYSANSLGAVTSEWLVAGYTSVRLIHGTAVTFATDTANDSVLYIRFNESLTSCNASDQAGCDTGAKPDLTTTASPGLADTGSNGLLPVQSSDVTESDGAKPLLITARSLSATAADVIFSEAMEESTAETALYYTINNGITVSAAVRDDGNNKIVHLTTSSQVGGTSYLLTVNTDVKDMANLSLDTAANTVTFEGNVKPIVVSIDTENSTTLTITFNETVTAASTECANLTACSAIYSSASLPIKSAVSTAGATNNSATYTLTVNPMVEGQNYTTSVIEGTATSVASGQTMGNVNNSATFTGDGNPGAYISTDTETECPTPTDLPPSSAAQTRVIVQYDQAVTATALTTTNYKIVLCLANAPCSTGTGSPNSVSASAVTSMGGNKYAVDFTDPFDSDSSEYQMNISNVADANGNVVTAPTNLGFRCGNDATPPSLIRANVVTANASTTQVMLTFSESVDQVTANTASSYKYDSQAYGYNVNSAARQSNYAQVLVTFAPGLAAGGHQIRVQNVQDLATTPNTILDNLINNVQPIIVTAPDSLGDGEVFQDPFNDGTKAALIVKYDNMLYLGTDSTSAKLFEVDYGLTTSQLILMDADGAAGAPVEDFDGYMAYYSGCNTSNPPSCNVAINGVDALYAACVGGTSTPDMTGSACTTAGGTETLFIGALNTIGYYKSFWHSTDKSSSTTTFTFTEARNPDSGGAAAYRSTVFVLFKDQLWNHYGAELGGGGRGGRVCMKVGGCDDGTPYLNTAVGGFPNMSRLKRIGASSTNSLRNGSYNNNTFNGQVPAEAYVLNAINVAYEHDNDGTGGNESQLYIANGGFYAGTLGSARTGTSDGGIMRTLSSYSSRASLPSDCDNNSDGCSEYWEDVTPDGNVDWNNYMSIMLPQNSAVTGAANCSTSSIEMDCTQPYNLFIPALKAIPYMRTAPNGDLYMIRNACSTTTVCLNGKTDCDFRTTRQTCPAGSEVPQLWMMPKNCGSASACASSWVLVAEYGTTGKTNMASNTGDCGSSPNKCTGNTHATLLEIVGNYLYVGFDNATYGANIWRTDMSSVASGSTPAETSFEMVNINGLDGTLTNQKLFSHITINEGGTDWLILTTRDGNNSVQIYRTANNQD